MSAYRSAERVRPWISSDDLAALLGVSERTVRRWRAAGTGPRFHLVGGQIRYHRQHVTAWLAAQEGGPSQNGGAPSREGVRLVQRGAPRSGGARAR